MIIDALSEILQISFSLRGRKTNSWLSSSDIDILMTTIITGRNVTSLFAKEIFVYIKDFNSRNAIFEETDPFTDHLAIIKGLLLFISNNFGPTYTIIGVIMKYIFL